MEFVNRSQWMIDVMDDSSLSLVINFHFKSLIRHEHAL